jgi:CRISPR/Cas system CMR-associated protein Cmr3 (group 5 of RAMP superfamily)
MAKRLTKALRGKRRWFGINVNNKFSTRNQLAEHLNVLSKEFELTKKIRLMDFELSSNSEFALAIIEVKLQDSKLLRVNIEDEKAIENFGIQSITTSGKIRLVRDRLNLTKKQ